MKKLASIVLLVLVVLAVAGTLAPSPVMIESSAEQGLPAWVSVEQAVDCSEGCWRVGSLGYKDEGEAQGLHHIFARARDGEQQWVEAEWHVAWRDGDVRLVTKRPPDWGDFPMFACFSPNEGEVGAYWVYAGAEPSRSDVVRGAGLPECLHVVYEVEWHWQEQVPMPPCELVECRRLYLPIVER